MSLNIVILTDFSEAAYSAANYALHLSIEKSNFYLLHIGNSKDQKLIDFTQKTIQNPKAKGHNFHAIRSTDNLINAIRKTVEEKRIDLIVMGVSAKNFSDLQGLGENSYNVIKKVKCPVLMVPKNFDFKSWDSVYFPVDARIPIPKSSLNLLKKLPVHSRTNFSIWTYNCGQNVEEKTDHQNTFTKILSGFKTDFKKIEDSPEFVLYFWKKANKSASLIMLKARHLKISETFLLRPAEETHLRQKMPVLILHD